jgi:excisionase family DNA binding protein
VTGVAWEAMVDEQTTIPTLTAAERLGVDVVEVYRMIDDGRLTASWDGKRLVAPVAEVESLVRSPS